MLAIGIKNAILFLLIILILHFLVKNILLDQNTKKPASAQSMKATPPTMSYFEGFVPASSMTDEKKKMMEFVNSEKDEQQALDKMFSQKIITECKAEEQCTEPKKDIGQLPLSTTCDADVTKLKGDGMKVKADCHLPQDHKNFTFITEYENERPLNSGKVFDGLSAFDTYDDYFQTYSSSCAALS